jgi:hypothetical protein
MPSQIIDNLVIPKASTSGIKVDEAAPTFPWRDIVGVLTPDPSGGTAPAWTAFQGVTIPMFDIGDEMYCSFHIPHDYVLGSDLYIHAHWTHNHDTGTTGAVTLRNDITYARRSMGTVRTFPTSKNISIALTNLNVATNAPQYVHRVDEEVITGSSDTATTFDRSTIEIDGMVLVKFTVPVISGLTGGTNNRVGVIHVDLHYQSTGMGTKDKAEPFYG